VTLFAVPGKTPLFLEREGKTPRTDLLGEQTVGVRLGDAEPGVFYIPGCAAVTPDLAERLRGAAAVMFDGTVFHDDEMIREGVGPKTGRRMGHLAMAGEDGSLAAFRSLGVRRKVYVHINNTNPVWRPGTSERRAVEAAGWEVAHDGLEIVPHER
jgi:pyrroloquinoline quinone biosynthesis protein B